MKKQIFFIIFFCIILSATCFYFYYKYEPEKQELINISISAEYEKKIKTGFIIITNSGEIRGNTSYSYELIRLPKQVIKIKNINLEDQNFYEDEKEYNLTKNIRIDLILSKPEKLEIKIIENESLFVELYSKNFKEIDFCLKGSLNYMFIRAENFTKIEKLEDYTNYDICYDGNFSLLDNFKTIKIDYTNYGTPNEKDFIDLVLIDKAKNSHIERVI